MIDTKGWAGIVGQWAMIASAIVGAMLHIEHRLTTVETAITEQMKGYTIMFQVLTQRLDRVERQLDGSRGS